MRIAPNEVSFSSPDAAIELFKTGKGFHKTDFYGVFPPPENPDIFTETRESVHGIKKRYAATPYSLASMQQSTPRIEATEKLLLSKLDEFTSGNRVCDLGDWLHFFAFDVSRSMRALVIDSKKVASASTRTTAYFSNRCWEKWLSLRVSDSLKPVLTWTRPSRPSTIRSGTMGLLARSHGSTTSSDETRCGISFPSWPPKTLLSLGQPWVSLTNATTLVKARKSSTRISSTA